MSLENQDFIAIQGTDFDIDFENIISETTGALVTSDSISRAVWGLVRMDNPYESALLITSDESANIEFPEDGKIRVKIHPEHFSHLDPGYYLHELKIDNRGRIVSLARGKMLLKIEIAKAYGGDQQ